MVVEKTLSHRAQTLSGCEWHLAESEINGTKEMGLLLVGVSFGKTEDGTKLGETIEL